jgi:hypothetical protein
MKRGSGGVAAHVAITACRAAHAQEHGAALNARNGYQPPPGVVAVGVGVGLLVLVLVGAGFEVEVAVAVGPGWASASLWDASSVGSGFASVPLQAAVARSAMRDREAEKRRGGRG